MNMSLRTLSLALVGLLTASCAKRATEGTAAPVETAAGAEPGDIDALEAELAAHEDQLRALGAAPPAGEALAAGDAVSPDVRAKRDASGGEATNDAMSKSAEVQTQSGGPAPATAPAAAERAEQRVLPGASNRCASVCEISTSICQLRDNICGLAPRHADEPRYQRACDRASVDCDFAVEACHACT